jgi:hypothetical protein
MTFFPDCYYGIYEAKEGLDVFLQLSYENIRILCREQIESFEYWAKRFIHNQLSKHYGENYFFYKLPDGNNLIKKELQESVLAKMKSKSSRFSRPIDAILFEDIIYLLCKEDFYKK